jgi:hypothetical protein
VDALLHVPWFVMAGMQGLLYTIVRGLMLMVVWGLVLYFISWFSAKGETEISVVGLVFGAGFLSVGSILLGLPSSLIARLVREENVSKLASYISTSGSRGTSAKLLQDGVARVEAAGQQRISGIGWGLGLI